MAYTQEQLNNARIIAQVGRSRGASDRDIQIAIATALQESGLRNLNYGDRDSLGLFQQRPSQGWGTVEQVSNPSYAAGKFFDALLSNPKRADMSLAQAAQAVQRSAYPSAYAKHESAAAALLSQVGGGDSTQTTTNTISRPVLTGPVEDQAASMAPGPQAAPQAQGTEAASALGIRAPEAGARANVPMQEDPTRDFHRTVSEADYISAASGGAQGVAGKIIGNGLRFQGTPYAWGGTSPLGFDCSGFVQYVFGKAGVQLPRVSYQQAAMGKPVALNDLQPGDLVFTDYSGRNPGADHVGIFMGNGKVLEAWLKGGVGVHDFNSDWWANTPNVTARRVL